MPDDMVYPSGIHLYDHVLSRNTHLSGFRTSRGVSFLTIRDDSGETGIEVFLCRHQVATLRDWLTARLAENDNT